MSTDRPTTSMTSWQARLLDRYVRRIIRRREWGTEHALARRARRVFGMPGFIHPLLLRGLKHERVSVGQHIRGEWISVDTPSSGGVILYIHGGGYVSGSAADRRTITGALTRITGLRVFGADYREAPESRFPAALDDVIAIYEWLVTEGAPGAPVALAGESAGGGLALAVAVHARDAGLPQPSCIVALSPWTDLTGSSESVRGNDGRCAMFHPENMSGFAAAYLGGAQADDPRASPVYAELHDLPPVLLQVGSTELLLDDARRVHERLLSANGRSTLSVYDDVPHAWQLMTPFIPEARTAVNEIAAFILDHMVSSQESLSRGLA